MSFVFEKVHALIWPPWLINGVWLFASGIIAHSPCTKARCAYTARAGFYFYNTRAEVDRFIEVLQKVIQLLK